MADSVNQLGPKGTSQLEKAWPFVEFALQVGTSFLPAFVRVPIDNLLREFDREAQRAGETSQERIARLKIKFPEIKQKLDDWQAQLEKDAAAGKK